MERPNFITRAIFAAGIALSQTPIDVSGHVNPDAPQKTILTCTSTTENGETRYGASLDVEPEDEGFISISNKLFFADGQFKGDVEITFPPYEPKIWSVEIYNKTANESASLECGPTIVNLPIVFK